MNMNNFGLSSKLCAVTCQWSESPNKEDAGTHCKTLHCVFEITLADMGRQPCSAVKHIYKVRKSHDVALRHVLDEHHILCASLSMTEYMSKTCQQDSIIGSFDNSGV